jgi:methanethiol oxidase
MVSSEWTAPKTFFNGFNPEDLNKKKYGQCIYFWNWREEKMIKKVDLGSEGMLPLELRFHHVRIHHYFRDVNSIFDLFSYINI